MAKSVIKNGLIKVLKINTAEFKVDDLMTNLHLFVDDYRKNPLKLRSFIVVLEGEDLESFEAFEVKFWQILSELSREDKKFYPHDHRVSDDPQVSNFGYSIKSEAFFILGLHPKSPRFARRFFKSTIVFNLHQQFEDMRKKGVFSKIRDMIRKKDLLLQGSINPMLADFGEKSEIFQYLGKVYKSASELNIQKGFFNASY